MTGKLSRIRPQGASMWSIRFDCDNLRIGVEATDGVVVIRNESDPDRSIDFRRDDAATMAAVLRAIANDLDKL
jgi:hypothetical protein